MQRSSVCTSQSGLCFLAHLIVLLRSMRSILPQNLQGSAPYPWLVTGLIATDHFIKVPLVHDGRPPGGETLDVFVRELVQPSLPGPHGNRPVLLYLQGENPT